MEEPWPSQTVPAIAKLFALSLADTDCRARGAYSYCAHQLRTRLFIVRHFLRSVLVMAELPGRGNLCLSMSGEVRAGLGGDPNPSDGDRIGQDLRIGVGHGEGLGKVLRTRTDLFFVAVHVGAGFHGQKKAKAYQLAMRRACQAAASVLSAVLDCDCCSFVQQIGL